MIFDRQHQFWQIVSKEYKYERTNKVKWNLRTKTKDWSSSTEIWGQMTLCFLRYSILYCSKFSSAPDLYPLDASLISFPVRTTKMSADMGRCFKEQTFSLFLPNWKLLIYKNKNKDIKVLDPDYLRS